MTSAKEERLEEIVWRAPELAQQMGGIHTNTVLFYFAESPFFERTSNNASLYAQAMNNQSIYPIIQTRQSFEERLRSMQGLEYLVTQDPSEGDKKQIHSGVWVIRKQTRRKRSGLSDEITPLANYFVLGESIYMAPSLGAILGTRLLSVLTSLTELHTTARALPLYNPAIGHTYLPPSAAAKHATPSSSFLTAAPSKAGTPIPGTPLPAFPKTIKHTDPKKDSDSRLLAESWHLAHEYGNDYMDDNPIIGEPGSFKLSKSHDFSLKTSRPANATPVAQPFSKKTPAESEKDGEADRGKKGAPPIKTTDLPPAKEKEKRATATPGTGKSPTSAEGGGGGFKDKKGRRKSKAVGAVGTPKERDKEKEKEKEKEKAEGVGTPG